MGLPRPLNWLREPQIDEGQIQIVQNAAKGMKQALDDAQEQLSEMEQNNASQVQNLSESLSEAISNIASQSTGVPNQMFIVQQWFGFTNGIIELLESDSDDNEEMITQLRSEQYRAVPFKSPELASAYTNQKIQLLQALAENGRYIRPENVEETPNDVLSRILLYDEEDNEIGYIQIRYWMYNPNQEIPEEVGGGTGDWV